MKVLVTGGGGFLGGAIVRRLIERGDSVRTFQRGSYSALERLGVETVRGDLAESADVDAAVQGCQTVFHVAAKAGVWGPREAYYRSNVVGTQNVLDACRRHRVSRLVYTSSPSVVFDGHDEEGIDETAPYAQNYLAHYPATKAQAERLVLEANTDGLATIALRPHLIWGPGDPHLVPRLLDRARRGRLKLIGRRPNLVDSTYIDNAATAHIGAAERLSADAACAGKAYFISNGEPLPMAELVNRILVAGGLPPVTRTVPTGLAYGVGGLLELAYRGLGIKTEPLLTRFVARQLSTAHWFNITAARRDLGYQPTVTIDEGMQRLQHALNEVEQAP